MKNIKKLYYENSIFRFMISYAGVLLIPLFVCLISYELAFTTVKQEIQENNLAMLNRSKNKIDQEIKLLNSLMMQSANNQTLLAIADHDNKSLNSFYYNATKAIKELAYIFRYTNTTVIDNVYIYLKDVNYVMTRYDMNKAPFFYHNVLKEKGEFETWTRKLTDINYYHKYFVTEDEIRYVQMLPFLINKPVKGAIVCVVDKKALASVFDNVKINEGTNLFIRDEEGNNILSLGEETSVFSKLKKMEERRFTYSQKINGKESIVLGIKSDVTNWYYTLVLPEDKVMHKLIQLKKTIWGLFTLAIAIGIMISYFMASKNGKPIEEMKKFLHSVGLEEELQLSQISTTSTLSGTFTKMVSQAQNLSIEIAKQKPYLEAVLFQKLLKGEFANEKEIQSLCQRTQINLKASAYWVVNFKVFINNDMYNLDNQTLEEANMLDLLIKELLKEELSKEIYFFDVDQLTTATIISKDAINYDQIKNCIHYVNEEIIKQYQVTPFWGISSEITDLLQLWRGFEQAKKALAVGTLQEDDNIMEYNNIVEDKMSYYYPLVFKNQLMTYTKEADEVGIKKHFELLYVENFEKRQLSEAAIRKLYLEIKRTVINLIKEDEAQEYMEELGEIMSSKELPQARTCFEEITQIFLKISSEFNQVKIHQQSKLITRMMKYINEVYADSNLGLGMVATKFNISEGYVSSLFKEQANINFTDYVEQQRINKACELLKDTKLNVNEIGEQVGYNSVQSFRRAFKRIHGFSPTELRKGTK